MYIYWNKWTEQWTPYHKSEKVKPAWFFAALNCQCSVTSEYTEFSEIRTLVYLLSEHVRLTIFQNLSGLYGLNRYRSLNFFQEKFKPVRLIDTVGLTFLRKKLAKTYDLLIKMQYYWSGIVINKNLYKFFCPGCFYQYCLLNCFLKNSEPVRLIDPVHLIIFGKILTLCA